MGSVLLPVRVVLDPLGAVPAAVRQRKWLIPLLFLVIATSSAGAMVASKLDVARVVVPALTKSGELKNASEREIEDQIEQAKRVALVGAVARGLFLMPLLALGLAVALKLVAWLFGRQALFAEAFSTACIALVPIAVFQLVLLISSARQGVLTPQVVTALVPASLAEVWQGEPSEKLKRVLGAVDVFRLWSVVLLGLGFSAATGLPKWRSLMLWLVVYALFAGAFFVGLPGLMTGGPDGGGGQYLLAGLRRQRQRDGYDQGLGWLAGRRV